MAVTFSRILDTDLPAKQLQAIMYAIHHDLHRIGVRFGMLFASNGDEPAIKVSKRPSAAKIKIVPLPDRLTKLFDAEIWLDERAWEGMCLESQDALLDHLLCSVELVRDSETNSPLTDDLGRPQLRMKLGQIAPGEGFIEVIGRHKQHALEYDNVRRAFLMAEGAAGEAV